MDILEGPDGRSKGCAVVLFDLADAARKAIGQCVISEVINTYARYFHISKRGSG